MRITRLHLLLGAVAVVLLAAGLLARYELPGAVNSPKTAAKAEASYSAASSKTPTQTPAAAAKAEAPVAAPSLAQGFTLPEGTKAIPYAVKRGDIVPVLASRYLSQVVYMRRSEVDAAIRQANGLSGAALKPGSTILIP